MTEEMFGAGHRRDAVTRIERRVWTSKECGERATAASAGSLACESRRRRPERRRCVLTFADVVRDELTIVYKKIEELRVSARSAWCSSHGSRYGSLRMKFAASSVLAVPLSALRELVMMSHRTTGR